MSISKYAVFLGFSLSLLSACGDDDEGASLQSICEKGCATIASLSCPDENATTCVSECEMGPSNFPDACRSQAIDVIECAANRPASDWECDSDGEAAPKEGVCAGEINAVVACASDGTCPFENDDECDDPTGTDLCPAGTDVADCS